MKFPFGIIKMCRNFNITDFGGIVNIQLIIELIIKNPPYDEGAEDDFLLLCLRGAIAVLFIMIARIFDRAAEVSSEASVGQEQEEEQDRADGGADTSRGARYG